MHPLIVNIGLAVGQTDAITATVAREILVANGFLIVRSAVHQSDTESTLVAKVLPTHPTAKHCSAALTETSNDLRQDCIAVWSPTLRVGHLFGDKAAAWGPFNPDFFLLLDGTRLGVKA